MENSVVITGKGCGGGWHHIAVVNDYPNLFIYFDGLFYYSVNTFGASCMYGSTVYTSYLGNSSSTTDYYSTVYIDDFRIHKVPLTQSDVSALVSSFRIPLCNLYVGNPPSNFSFYIAKK